MCKHDVINIQHADCSQALTARRGLERPLPATGIPTRQAQGCVWASLPQPGGDVEQPVYFVQMGYDVMNTTGNTCHITKPPEEVEPRPQVTNINKKLSYRRVTARCVLSVVILPITTQRTVQKLLIRQVLTEPMVWSWRFSWRQCVINKPTTVELCISPVYRRLAVAKFFKSTM